MMFIVVNSDCFYAMSKSTMLTQWQQKVMFAMYSAIENTMSLSPKIVQKEK